jgi:hypothetical protein
MEERQRLSAATPGEEESPDLRELTGEELSRHLARLGA